MVRFSLLALLSITAFAGFAQDRVWITLDATEAPAIQQALKSAWQVDLTVHEANIDGLAIARIARDDIYLLSHLMHEQYRRCSGFLAHADEAAAHRSISRFTSARTVSAKRGAYTIDNPDAARALEEATREENIADVITSLSSFQNRFYNTQDGVNAAHWLRDYWTDLIGDRSDASVALFSHGGFPQPSVVLSIEGTRFPDEIVVVGGHLDSTAGTLNSPGADDDASGIATLTEVVRAIFSTDFRPEHSLRFIGYAGEEAGLLGSQDIADEYQRAGANVIGVMQLDMTNYNGSAQDIWFLSDNTNGPLTSFSQQLMDTYLDDISYNNTACGYGCSDHASWHREGYPAVMPFEARMGQHNHNIHSSGDTLDFTGGHAQHAHKFARLAAVFVAELAKGEMGPVASPLKQARVDIHTLGTLLAEMGPCPQDSDCFRDLNNDGTVDLVDLRQLLPDWLSSTCLGFVEGPGCD